MGLLERAKLLRENAAGKNRAGGSLQGSWKTLANADSLPDEESGRDVLKIDLGQDLPDVKTPDKR